MQRLPKFLQKKLQLGGANILGEGNPFAWNTNNYQHPTRPTNYLQPNVNISQFLPQGFNSNENIQPPELIKNPEQIQQEQYQEQWRKKYPKSPIENSTTPDLRIGRKPFDWETRKMEPFPEKNPNKQPLIDGMYVGNALLRGFSENYSNNQRRQYEQDNLANPLNQLGFNEGRSRDVKYGYQQFQKGGSTIDKLMPLPKQPLNRGDMPQFNSIIPLTKEEIETNKTKNTISKKGLEDYHKKALEERQKRIDVSNNSNQNVFSKDYYNRQNVANTVEGTPDKMRLFPNSTGAGAAFDEYLNPAYIVGSVAKSLGRAPLEAQQSNSNLPYLTALAEPLAFGAMGFSPIDNVKTGVKQVAKQIALKKINNEATKLGYGTAEDLLKINLGSNPFIANTKKDVFYVNKELSNNPNLAKKHDEILQNLLKQEKNDIDISSKIIDDVKSGEDWKYSKDEIKKAFEDKNNHLNNQTIHEKSIPLFLNSAKEEIGKTPAFFNLGKNELAPKAEQEGVNWYGGMNDEQSKLAQYQSDFNDYKFDKTLNTYDKAKDAARKDAGLYFQQNTKNYKIDPLDFINLPKNKYGGAITLPKKQQGGSISKLGYSRNSPYKNSKFLDIHSRTGNITMENTDFPLLGEDEHGFKQVMLPGNNYKFRGQHIRETPIMQQKDGGVIHAPELKGYFKKKTK